MVCFLAFFLFVFLVFLCGGMFFSRCGGSREFLSVFSVAFLWFPSAGRFSHFPSLRPLHSSSFFFFAFSALSFFFIFFFVFRFFFFLAIYVPFSFPFPFHSIFSSFFFFLSIFLFFLSSNVFCLPFLHFFLFYSALTTSLSRLVPGLNSFGSAEFLLLRSPLWLLRSLFLVGRCLILFTLALPFSDLVIFFVSKRLFAVWFLSVSCCVFWLFFCFFVGQDSPSQLISLRFLIARFAFLDFHS